MCPISNGSETLGIEPYKRRIKSHLPFADIIRSSTFKGQDI